MTDLDGLIARLNSKDHVTAALAAPEAAATIEKMQTEIMGPNMRCPQCDQLRLEAGELHTKLYNAKTTIAFLVQHVGKTEWDELTAERDALRAELAECKAREPEAWFFECWTRGKHAQFASVDKDDHSWWPTDQWITVHRTPLCLNGEKECLHDARAQAGEK